MKREEIESKLREMVAGLFGVEGSDLEYESRMIEDLQADSLDVVELIMMIEDEFDIQIKDEEAEKAVTFGLVVDLVDKSINGS